MSVEKVTRVGVGTSGVSSELAFEDESADSASCVAFRILKYSRRARKRSPPSPKAANAELHSRMSGNVTVLDCCCFCVTNGADGREDRTPVFPLRMMIVFFPVGESCASLLPGSLELF